MSHFGHLQSLVSSGSQSPYIETESDNICSLTETVKIEVPAISKQVHFTAGLKYNDNQELYRPTYPNQPEYVGEPSPEMDAAWDDLIGGRSSH